MKTTTYEAPVLRELGSVRELTLMPSPPGKNGKDWDGSSFITNFSCVGDSGNGSCAGGAPVYGD